MTVETFGRLDYAFNNAGMLNDPNRLGDVPGEEFGQVINVDLKGAFFFSSDPASFMNARVYPVDSGQVSS